MPSLVAGCEYDIFISYRQKDNKGDHWVTGFVDALRAELDATFKEDISIYFDENPHDGLHENYDVDDSLREKLKCAVFFPIVSRTYCDSQSFAWVHELKAFVTRASADSFGLKIKLANGNTTSRVLAVRIHDLEAEDTKLFESETHSVFRPIDFVFKSSGVNRPLLPSDKKEDNQGRIAYRDQINKVANAIREIIMVMQKPGSAATSPRQTKEQSTVDTPVRQSGFKVALASLLVILLAAIGYILWKSNNKLKDPKESGLAILQFKNSTGDADLEYFGVGMASEIRTQISMSKQFQNISAMQAVLPYSNTQKSTREIGDELGVDFILSGLYQKTANKIKVEAELIDAATGKLLWTLPLESEMNDLLGLQANIGREVLNRLTGNSSTDAVKSTLSLEAYAKNAKGIDLFYGGALSEKSGTIQGIKLFKEAIALDSAYIDAWVNLIEAEGYAYLNDWITSKDNLDRYLSYIDKHFPGTWQKDLAHGIHAYKVSHKYDESEAYLNKVLDTDPQNFMALSNLSYAYKRRLDFKNALLLKQKCLMLDPGNGGVWKDLGDVFRLMGDYKSALKATLKAAELSESSFNPLMAVYTSVYGNLPLEQLPEDVKTRARSDFDLATYAIKDDWKQVTRQAVSAKQYLWVCVSYFEREMADSARYWGSWAAKNQRDGFGEQYQAFAGNRDKALEVIEAEFKTLLETGVDKMSFCHRHVSRIYVFIYLQDYAEATRELKRLNADFPEFGDYGQFTSTWFQKQRRDYPLFQEALDNLKLRRSAELEQIIKF